ncbi:RING finger protein, nitrosative stress-induced transcript [Histoplasma ohiense]|nr:RING finger protein, nitrosative stress-induced transcript [Histoplasma ohiense (nom. inval.)]
MAMPTAHYICIPLSQGTLSVKELDQANMRRLSGTFIAKDEDNSQNQEETDCILCFETLHRDMKFRELPCRHVFHQPCIDDWLSKRDASCPLCRRTFYHLRRPQSQSLKAPSLHELSTTDDFALASPLHSEVSFALSPSSPASSSSSSSQPDTMRQATAYCRGPWEVFKWWRRHRQRRRELYEGGEAWEATQS